MANSDSLEHTKSPLMPDVGVLAVVPDEWDDVWQPRHHIMIRLAKYFNIVWFGPMRDRQALWKASKKSQLDSPAPGFEIYAQDRWLPVAYRPKWLVKSASRLRLWRAKSILRAAGVKRTVLYMWRPEFVAMLDDADYDSSAYHIDDEYTFSPTEQPISSDEYELISRADQVFMHSPALLRKKGHINSKTAFIPNGVDFHAYSSCDVEADDIAAIPHPRIGYVGRIKPQLDLQLLLELSQIHSDLSFVLVGPLVSTSTIEDEIRSLQNQQNVYFLGNKPVGTLPTYNCFFDVCMLCYRMDDYTKFIYPMKVHEYLATGLPVVGSPIESLLEFADTISLAQTREEWSAALLKSLSPEMNTTEMIKHRQSVARRHDWDVLALNVAVKMCNELGPSYSKRLNDFLQSSTFV
ncbi:MAG: glycosyltransferase [Acidobacteriota bacterium]|nr:glycosyltransferase [Acidobacteriota bacterium]